MFKHHKDFHSTCPWCHLKPVSSFFYPGLGRKKRTRAKLLKTNWRLWVKRSWKRCPTPVTGMNQKWVEQSFGGFSQSQRMVQSKKSLVRISAEHDWQIMQHRANQSLSSMCPCALFPCPTATVYGTQRPALATSPPTPPPSPTLKTMTATLTTPASTPSASHRRPRPSSAAHPRPKARQRGPSRLRLPWRSWMVYTQRWTSPDPLLLTRPSLKRRQTGKDILSLSP